MIVRVHGIHRPEWLAKNFVGAVCDYLIGVHVGLCAGTGLPDNQWEVVRQLSGCDLRRSPHDCPATLLIKRAEMNICEGGGLFLPAEGFNDRVGHFFGPDGEVFDASLRLSAPVTVRWYRDAAHQITLCAGLFSGHIA